MICFDEIKTPDFGYIYGKKPQICQKCFTNFKPVFKDFYVDNIMATAIYNYDENIQKLLYTFKGCYDVELRTVFLFHYSWYFKLKYNGYYLVPAPSYFSDDTKRGFNHVEEIFSSLKLPLLKVFIKTKQIKQSGQHSDFRKDIYKYIKMSDTKIVKNKKILIVDDIYTTGSTIRTMIKLLEKEKPADIKVLVLAKAYLHS